MRYGKAIVAVAAGLAIGSATLLWPGVRPALRSAGEAWDEQVERSASFEARARGQEQLLAAMDRTIADQAGAVAGADEWVGRREEELRELEGRAEKERDLLCRERALLEQGREEYRIAGRQFTREAVEADARRRAEGYDRLRGRIESRRQHLGRLRATLLDARAALAAARAGRQARQDELIALTDRKRAAEVLAGARAAADGVGGTADGPGARLRRQMDRLAADVASAEAAARPGADDPAPIPWHSGDNRPAAGDDAAPGPAASRGP